MRIAQQVTVRGERFGGGPPEARPANAPVEVEPGRR
jgi:hypothetical protein